MYGFFFDQKKIYIILEYACGGALYEYFQLRGRFEESVSSKYTAQMLSAVKYIHSLNIIHRDLKPENILICENDSIKLSDFGWSTHTSKSRKTCCGTTDYIGPEMFIHQTYNTKIDMWTLGVFAFELSSGRAPFASVNRH